MGTCFLWGENWPPQRGGWKFFSRKCSLYFYNCPSWTLRRILSCDIDVLFIDHVLVFHHLLLKLLGFRLSSVWRPWTKLRVGRLVRQLTQGLEEDWEQTANSTVFDFIWLYLNLPFYYERNICTQSTWCLYYKSNLNFQYIHFTMNIRTWCGGIPAFSPDLWWSALYIFLWKNIYA